MVHCQIGAASLVEARAQGDRVEEDRLIERSRRGDLSAFDQLVAAHYPQVFAVARRLLPCPDDAADVAQEVFLAAWRQLGQFRRRSSFRTWLHAICLRQCARSARAARVRPASLDAPDAPEPPLPEGGAPESVAERRQRDAALHAAVHTLPRAQREAVVLHYFGGLTCPETAAAMGVSAGAVMTHLFRARKSLRSSLSWLADQEASR
jgi:RNA polymerase sigma-70 factor (ECF subfamily)